MTIEFVEQLCRAIEDGAAPKYLPFWGHTPRPGGALGASCLSQWWPAAFTVDGIEFATAEHYMMWRKAVLFDDAVTAGRILAVPHPSQAKKLGRQIRAFDDAVWQGARFEIVVAGSIAKFGSDEALRRYLVGTGKRVLVEASPVDRIWGIGLAVDDPRATDPAQWKGLNLLGFALMRARDALAG
ncbi:NADAR family protein [Nocardia sp. NPDC059177]|uniref:NADAR family protein n=1 Tax=Nocardia sp. NPDC059177 TaxID=3346759 RepID=UPI00367FDD1B